MVKAQGKQGKSLTKRKKDLRKRGFVSVWTEIHKGKEILIVEANEERNKEKALGRAVH